ncbi:MULTISPECIES: sensor histidine kinase [Phenylobacterium]|uniref:histidine kinase n=1 Tax=Phenylobacterium koreense TaxID=266125 RepID=A0ABV2EHC6_9CAUL
MLRLGNLNLRSRLAPDVPTWVTEWVCAGLCASFSGLLRLCVDLLAPGTPPYLFFFPFVLLATLLAGWRSGVIALTIMMLGVWYMILSPARFGPLDSVEATTLILNGLSGLAVVAVAQAFRRAYELAQNERAAKLEVRELLLRELNHRVKNNFQMVEALLDMQRRRAKDDQAAAALSDALRRVHSMAQAHAFLYSPENAVEQIDLGDYLHELCSSLSDSLLQNGLVRLDCRTASWSVSRDRAVAVGLVVNELVTNAAKYAFPDGRSGQILVALSGRPEGCELTVADDGIGMPGVPLIKAEGMGRKLVESFARQSGGVLTEGAGPGVSYVLMLPN